LLRPRGCEQCRSLCPCCLTDMHTLASSCLEAHTSRWYAAMTTTAGWHCARRWRRLGCAQKRQSGTVPWVGCPRSSAFCKEKSTARRLRGSRCVGLRERVVRHSDGAERTEARFYLWTIKIANSESARRSPHKNAQRVALTTLRLRDCCMCAPCRAIQLQPLCVTDSQMSIRLSNFF
jgi:hypothetical protein